MTHFNNCHYCGQRVADGLVHTCTPVNFLKKESAESAKTSASKALGTRPIVLNSTPLQYEALSSSPSATARPVETVDHPSHYQTESGIECIDAIEAALTPEEFAGFCKGNSLKYLWRAGKKGEKAKDIGKAQWYLKKMQENM